MSTEDLWRTCGRGESLDEFSCLTTELEHKGVLKRHEDGYLYSSRMVRDETLRQKKASAGSKGGSSRKQTGSKPEANGQTPTKAKRGSSTSSSASTIYIPGPDVIVPPSINTPTILEPLGKWIAWLNESEPSKRIDSNSPQEQSLLQMVAGWNCSTTEAVQAINQSIAGKWTNLHPPKGNPNGKSQSNGRSSVSRVQQEQDKLARMFSRGSSSE